MPGARPRGQASRPLDLVGRRRVVAERVAPRAFADPVSTFPPFSGEFQPADVNLRGSDPSRSEPVVSPRRTMRH